MAFWFKQLSLALMTITSLSLVYPNSLIWNSEAATSNGENSHSSAARSSPITPNENLNNDPEENRAELGIEVDLGEEKKQVPIRITWKTASKLTPEMAQRIREEQKRTGIPFIIWVPQTGHFVGEPDLETRKLISKLRSHMILVETKPIDPHLLSENDNRPQAIMHDFKSKPYFTMGHMIKKTFVKPLTEDVMVGTISGIATLLTGGIVWFGMTKGISPYTAFIATMIQTGILYSQFRFVRFWDRLYSYNYGALNSQKRGSRVTWLENFARRQAITFGITHLVNLYTQTMSLTETVELVMMMGSGSAFFQAIRNKVFADHARQSRKVGRWAHINAYLLISPFALANTAGLTGPKIFDLSFVGFPEIGMSTTPFTIFSLYVASALLIKFKPQAILPLVEWQQKKLVSIYERLLGRPYHDQPCYMLMALF